MDYVDKVGMKTSLTKKERFYPYLKRVKTDIPGIFWIPARLTNYYSCNNKQCLGDNTTLSRGNSQFPQESRLIRQHHHITKVETRYWLWTPPPPCTGIYIYIETRCWVWTPPPPCTGIYICTKWITTQPCRMINKCIQIGVTIRDKIGRLEILLQVRAILRVWSPIW